MTEEKKDDQEKKLEEKIKEVEDINEKIEKVNSVDDGEDIDENLEVDDQMPQNENFAEDYYQNEEEGNMEDIDSELEIEGFIDETVAEKFTLKKLKQYHDALEEREKVEFLVEYNGVEDLVYITIEKNFLQSDIVAMLQEYMKKIDVLRTKKVEMQTGFLEMYLIFQIIKHFTDIEMPKSIENQLVVLQRLINTGLLFNIFVEFPREQIDKVLMEVQAMNMVVKENFEMFENQMKNIKEEDLNSEIVKSMINEEKSKE
jgi:hypothetical protein